MKKRHRAHTWIGLFGAVVFALSAGRAAGRTYRIQTSDTLSATWQTTTVSRAGTGGDIILTLTNSPAAQCHYRIAITCP